MTPFNLLRLDMLPAHAVPAGDRSWAVEAELSWSNTFAMSDSVATYLESRGVRRRALTQADADAILGLGRDAYYVDGEFGLLELTAHYWVAPRTSLYATLSAYDFTGGHLDGTIEGFHRTFNLPSADREYVASNRFQAVMALDGRRLSYLDAPVDRGVGDPVLGVRQDFPLGDPHWNLVLSGEVKLAWRGTRILLSTGTNDYGLQMAVQGKFRRQAVYLSGSVVRTDGEVFDVDLKRRFVPTLIAAYEVRVTKHTNVVGQVYTSQSTVRDSQVAEISADKYQVSLGVRSRRGHVIYGLAVTENIENFNNTPDVGMTFSLAWISSKPGNGARP